MDQRTFAELEYASKKRRTRREAFLEKMDRLIPWSRLEEAWRAGARVVARGRGAAWDDASWQEMAGHEGNRGAQVDWRVAMRLGKRRFLDKAEHLFLHVKRRFGYAKMRHRGLAKNTRRIALLIGLSNLLVAGAAPPDAGSIRSKLPRGDSTPAAWPEKSDASHARLLLALQKIRAITLAHTETRVVQTVLREGLNRSVFCVYGCRGLWMKCQSLSGTCCRARKWGF